MRRTTLAVLCAAMMASGTASAQERPDGWELALTPYMWFSGISGSISLPRGGTEDFSADFGDIFDALKLGFMGTFEARRGRFSIITDLFYTNLEQGFNSPASIAVSSGSVRTTTTEFSIIGMYRAVEDERYFIDVGAGLRAWWIDTRIDANAGLFAGQSASSSKNLVNGIIAGRVGIRLNDRISLIAYGDVGGFNIDSKLTWQAIGAVDWRITESISAVAGWRHIQVDTSNSGANIDIALSGPFLGATFRF
jgi:hypothetical protein